MAFRGKFFLATKPENDIHSQRRFGTFFVGRNGVCHAVNDI